MGRPVPARLRPDAIARAGHGRRPGRLMPPPGRSLPLPARFPPLPIRFPPLLLPLVLLATAAQGCLRREAGTPPDEPFVVPSVSAPAEKAVASELCGWADEVDAIPGIGAGRLVRVPAFAPDGAPAIGLTCGWTTDEWIFGWRGGRPGALEMPGEGPLSPWGRANIEKALGAALVGLAAPRREPAEGGRFDRGGAIMASPPVPGFPFGRLLVARHAHPAIKDFFRAQNVQAGRRGELIELDTSWLKVGHVDEIVNFLPDPGDGRSSDASGTAAGIGNRGSGAGGFMLVLADPAEGLRLLAAAGKSAPGRAVFCGAGTAEFAGKVAGSGNRWLDSAEDIPPGKWRFVRIWDGKGAGQTARVWRTEGRRVTVERVWDLRDMAGGASRSASRGLASAVSGRCDDMPIWFEWPDGTSRYLLVSDSKMWLDASGADVPAVMAAGELASDPVLASVNSAAAARCRAAGRIVRRAIPIGDGRILRIPVVFASCSPEGIGSFALLPNNVNFQVFDREAICLQPCGPRADPARDDSDPFLEAARRALGSTGLNVRVLDGWNAIHRLNGGARCGINVLRRPDAGGR
ncbi:MAG: protein-arginine deiminase domain-containing protein [Planctomycetota bacterium]|nr:protein-arginine deiminase domain-containing protein [Planctomycetota bacterium]